MMEPYKQDKKKLELSMLGRPFITFFIYKKKL